MKGNEDRWRRDVEGKGGMGASGMEPRLVMGRVESKAVRLSKEEEETGGCKSD